MIEIWLEEFKKAWLDKDIPMVLSLFDENVEYWETPFKKITSKAELTKEWAVINQQENLVISTTPYASENNKHSVYWGVVYEINNIRFVWNGVYLIELNSDGKCIFFYQVGEKKQ